MDSVISIYKMKSLQEINHETDNSDINWTRVVLGNGVTCLVPSDLVNDAEPLPVDDEVVDAGHFSDFGSNAGEDPPIDGPIVDEVETHGPEVVGEQPLQVHLFDNDKLSRFTQDFIRRCNKRRMNKAQRQEMWSMISDWNFFEPSEMQSYESMTRKLKAALPTPTVHWKVKCLRTGKIFCGKGDKFPEKRFKNKRQFETMSIWTRIKLKDLIRYHAAQHPDAEYIVGGLVDFRKVHLSFTYDGIPNGKSSPDNLHVMGVQFRGCRQVYIPCVRVARRRERKNLSKFLDFFVQECFSIGAHVDFFLADAPMRSFLKC